jgi:hypothetical protein
MQAEYNKALQEYNETRILASVYLSQPFSNFKVCKWSSHPLSGEDDGWCESIFMGHGVLLLFVDNTIRIMDVESLSHIATVQNIEEGGGDALAEPFGDDLFAVCERKQSKILIFNTKGEIITILETNERIFSLMGFGNYICFSDFWSICVFDIRTSRQVLQINPNNGYSTCCECSQFGLENNKLLVSQQHHGDAAEIWEFDLSTQEWKETPNSIGSVRKFTMSNGFVTGQNNERITLNHWNHPSNFKGIYNPLHVFGDLYLGPQNHLVWIKNGQAEESEYKAYVAAFDPKTRKIALLSDDLVILEMKGPYNCFKLSNTCAYQDIIIKHCL